MYMSMVQYYSIISYFLSVSRDKSCVYLSLLPSWENLFTGEMSEELYRILSTIDVLKDQLNKLKFLAQAVVPSGPQLENCNSIPELFKQLRESQSLQHLDYRYAVSLLRHMLASIGCNQGKKLQPHCHKEFNLAKTAPTLVFFYEPLLHSADRLLRNGSNYKYLLNSTDENMLSKPKSDISSPLDLFQSMICKGALDPGNPHSLKRLVTILGAAGLENEAELFRQSLQPGMYLSLVYAAISQ